MNSLFLATFLCMGAMASASAWASYGPLWGAYGHDAGGLHKYGPAPLGHDGRVVDTPAVAHAKVQHYAAYHNAAKENSIAPGHGYAPAHAAPWAAAPWGGHGLWNGPYAGAHVQLTHDGYLKDTPEVAHAKAQHLAAKAAAAHDNHHYGYGHHDW